MKIGIISDIHDNQPNLDRCLEWLAENGIEKIICLGDTANIDTVSHLAGRFPGEIFLVRGNCDNYRDSDLVSFANINNLEEAGTAEIDGLRIGLVHEPAKIKALIGNGLAYDFIFHGHTHKPWIEKEGGATIANPGNLSGTIYPATFAFLDTSKGGLELKLLENL